MGEGKAGRPYDVVLMGATGFTGQLVAEYLVRQRMGALRWALAGRNRDKLAGVRDALAAIDPAASELALEVADSHDPASLAALAEKTRVVCTTVGPYAKYGSELVAACVERGADYCDLTGETHWVRRMIDAHHEAARESGARIVHFCGFDSIPSDLGVHTLQEHMREAHGGQCDRITFYLWRASGGFSGGTIDSMINTIETVREDRSVLRVLGDPYGLNPEGERKGPDRGDQRGVAYSEEAGGWTGPFVMASVNTRVVRRTNALLDYPYGEDFRYREVSRYPKGVGGLAKAAAMSGGLTAFMGAVAVPWTRELLVRHVLPSPGEGPSREKIEAGHFEVRLYGEGEGDDGRRHQVRARVKGDRDPGYGATATMLAESALCLALDRDVTDGLEGGVLTPASAMGAALTERLRAAGMTIEAEG